MNAEREAEKEAERFAKKLSPEEREKFWGEIDHALGAYMVQVPGFNPGAARVPNHVRIRQVVRKWEEKVPHAI